MLLCLVATALVPAARAADGLPSFAELEAAGALIGEVRVNPQSIFDLDDPRENNFLFRLANRLHIHTKPGVIAKQLLFKPGDKVSVRAIEETERLLRGNHYLHDVEIRPVGYRDGVVDIEVRTHDTWSLDPGLSYARAGGVGSSRLYVTEHNFLGSGVTLGLARSSNVNRAGTELTFKDAHALGEWTGISGSVANLTDGSQYGLSVARPFYSLDARWAAGASVSHSDALSSLYEKGETIAQYRSRQDSADFSAGWSAGLQDGWVRRYSLGFSHQSSEYALESGATPPQFLPADMQLSGPYARFELIEDAYEKAKNRDHIERPEYFAMGLHTSLQLGRSMSTFGSTQDSWNYAASIGKGFRSFRTNTLLTSASIASRYHDGHRENQMLGASARYYVPHGERWLFSAALNADVARQPDTPAPLTLGGDNGLRGYPLSYQSGERRVLMTLEERAYTDWYPFRLLRVGGAVFMDVGRAWHGTGQQTAGQRALTDVGFGLRLQNSRAAFGSVLHVDLAFPLHAPDDIRSMQILVKSHASF
jgi:outer membrane protein assembly factor BamA